MQILVTMIFFSMGNVLKECNHMKEEIKTLVTFTVTQKF